MTREQFLARCALIWDTGHATPEHLRLLRDWVDAVMRYEAHYFGADPGGSQLGTWDRFLEEEKRRIERMGRNDRGGYLGLLANDRPGYGLQEFAAILTHPCQTCATDKDAWWTRAGFCPHREVTP